MKTTNRSTTQAESDKVLDEAIGSFSELEYEPLFSFTAPTCAGVLSIKNSKGDVIYIGESSDLSERIDTHKTNTYFSTLRRKVGVILGCELISKTAKGKKNYLSLEDDKRVDGYLATCTVAVMPVSLNRRAVKDRLVEAYNPILNLYPKQLEKMDRAELLVLLSV